MLRLRLASTVLAVLFALAAFAGCGSDARQTSASAASATFPPATSQPSGASGDQAPAASVLSDADAASSNGGSFSSSTVEVSPPSGTVEGSVDSDAPFTVEVGSLTETTGTYAEWWPRSETHVLRLRLRDGVAAASVAGVYVGGSADEPPRISITGGDSCAGPPAGYPGNYGCGASAPAPTDLTREAPSTRDYVVYVNRDAGGLAPFVPGTYEITFDQPYWVGQYATDPSAQQSPKHATIHLTYQLQS